MEKPGNVGRIKSVGQWLGASGDFYRQIYGEPGCATDPDESGEKNLAQFKGLMELAAEFGAMVNIGRVRGPYSRSAVGSGRQFSPFLGKTLRSRKTLELLILEPVNE